MKLGSGLLFWIGVACLAIFCFPSISHQDLPNGSKDRIAIGLPHSPWFERIVTTTNSGTSSSGVQMIHELHEQNLRLTSWSSLFPLLGIVLIVAKRYR